MQRYSHIKLVICSNVVRRNCDMQCLVHSVLDYRNKICKELLS